MRLDPYGLLGLHEGEAHVIRNAGGVITDDEIRSLAVSQRLLGTEEVVLIDTDGDVRESLRRIRDSPLVPHKDGVRGFVYEVTSGGLTEVS